MNQTIAEYGIGHAESTSSSPLSSAPMARSRQRTALAAYLRCQSEWAYSRHAS